MGMAAVPLSLSLVSGGRALSLLVCSLLGRSAVETARARWGDMALRRGGGERAGLLRGRALMLGRGLVLLLLLVAAILLLLLGWTAVASLLLPARIPSRRSLLLLLLLTLVQLFLHLCRLLRLLPLVSLLVPPARLVADAPIRARGLH